MPAFTEPDEPTMDIALRVDTPDFAASEIRTTVADALRNETEQAQFRRDSYRDRCQQFESEHGYSSDEFMLRFDAGELGDDERLFHWYAAKRGFDHWDRKHRILSGR